MGSRTRTLGRTTVHLYALHGLSQDMSISATGMETMEHYSLTGLMDANRCGIQGWRGVGATGPLTEITSGHCSLKMLGSLDELPTEWAVGARETAEPEGRRGRGPRIQPELRVTPPVTSIELTLSSELCRLL